MVTVAEDEVRATVEYLAIAEWPLWPPHRKRETWTATHWSPVALAEFELLERCYRRGSAWLAMAVVALQVGDCHGDHGRISHSLSRANLAPWPCGSSATQRAAWRRRQWHWCEADYYERAEQAAPGRSPPLPHAPQSSSGSPGNFLTFR